MKSRSVLHLAASMALLSVPVTAAPKLTLERSDNSEVTRTGRVVSWGEQSIWPSTPGTAQFENVVSIAAGYHRTVAIKQDGTIGFIGSYTGSDLTNAALLTNVKAADSNFFSGVVCKNDGTLDKWRGPTAWPAGLTDVADLVAGDQHMLALKADGTVVAWGSNTFGESQVPAGLAGVVGISSNYYHNVAVKSDGTVVAWGSNTSGQCNVPAGLTGVKAVAAGWDHTVALRTNGTLVSWGSGAAGQLTPPANLGQVTAIAAGYLHTAALKTDGTVVMWGYADQYQKTTVPPYLGRVSAITSGRDHMSAITHRPIESYGAVGMRMGSSKTFSVRNTGADPLNLGSISNSGANAADFVVTASGWPSVLPPGGSASFSVTFTPPDWGLRSTVLRIPSNDPETPSFDFAFTGYGINLPPVVTDHPPVTVQEDDQVGVEIELPGSDPNGDPITYHFSTSEPPATMLVDPLGGNRFKLRPKPDFHGQVVMSYYARDQGLDISNIGHVTVTVASVNDLPFISVPREVVTAVPSSPQGANVTFTAGAGDIEDGKLPVVLTANGSTVSSGSLFPPGDTVVEASATDSNGATVTGSFIVRVAGIPSLRIKESGVEIKQRRLLVTWGEDSSYPSTIPAGLTEVRDFAALEYHTVAVRLDGTVAAWGPYNNYGQNNVPAGLSNVVQVATSSFHVLALKDDGTVVAWGSNDHGQATVPAGLTGVVAIAAGNYRSLALKSDGTLVAWGMEPSGLPIVSPAINDGVAIWSGTYHFTALRRDGTVVAWGSNSSGGTDVPPWLSGVAGIGAMHAIRSNGSLVLWGYDADAVAVPADLGPIVSLVGGDDHTAALRGDGTVRVWGSNAFFMSPPAGLTNVRKISSGDDYMLALRAAPGICDWGTVTAYAPVTKTLSFHNEGSGLLEITGATISGGLPGEFSVDLTGTDGSLTPGESTTVQVTFSPKVPGLRQATLQVSSNDGSGAVPELALSGTWQNSAPVATAAGPLALTEDQPGGLEVTLPATDANGNTLSFSIVSPPSAAQGSLGPVTGNKVTFTPAPDFNGTATFTFKANDGFLDSNVATVTLTVSPLNDTPRLTLPTEPVVVPTWYPDGSIAEFLAFAFDPEEGLLNPTLTVGGVPVHSGSFFPPGDTEVVVTATDSTGLTVTSSFIVRVVPGPKLVVETTSGILPQQSKALAWGSNGSGRTSIPVSAGSVTAVAAGATFSMALQPDGKVVAWGAVSSGQTNVPAFLSGVVAISAGWAHAVALKSDGTVVAWGSNGYGESTVPAGLAGVVAIDAGDYFTLALKQDGTVVGWGRNDSGAVSIPAGLVDVVAISGGGEHALALKRDGTVVAWGSNSLGQAAVPAGLSAVKSIAAGGAHSVVLRQDGSVIAWGSNTYGQATVPAGLAPVKQIAAGSYHTLVLKQDRVIAGWGLNTSGQRTPPSDPGRIESIATGYEHSLAVGKAAAPFDFGLTLQGVSDVTTLTLRNEGPGDLVFGQVNLTSGDFSLFSIVEGVADPVLASGESTTMKVAFAPVSNGGKKATLTIRTNQSDHPVMQLALTGHGRNGSPVASNLSRTVSEDPANGLSITLPATDPEGDLLTYRALPYSYEMGNLGSIVGNTVTYYPAENFNGVFTFSFVANDGGTDSNAGTVTVTVTPVNDTPVITYLPSSIRVTTPLAGGTTVSFRQPTISDVEDGSITPQLRIGGTPINPSTHVFPVGTTTVQVRGFDSSTGSVTASLSITVESVTGSAIQLEAPSGTSLFRTPAVVSWTSNTQISTEIPPELRGVKQITAGPDYGIALRNDGTLLGWGGNSQSKLNFPTGLVTATKVRAGTSFAMALRGDGTVAAWGSNTNGELTLPTLSGVIDIAAGASHAIACKSDGTVVGWGLNDSGQRTVPAGLTGVTAVAAGTSHTLALKSDGTVTGWGLNTNGQRSIPASLSGVAAIAAGAYHSLALKSDGTVVAWGRSNERQTSVPPSLTGVVAIAAGAYHSMALKSDGTVVAWGYYSVSGPLITSVPAQVSSARWIAGGSSLMAAVDHSAETTLGTVPTGSQATQIVTVRNRGNAALALSSITRISGSEDFTVQTSGMASSVASGQTTTFTLAFNSSSSGPKNARFRITSNDRYEPAYEVTVSGEGVPPFRSWAASAGLGETGVNPEAAPHGDGVASLLKYAFNMNGSGPDIHSLVPGTGTSGLPAISLQQDAEGDFLRVEFVRRRSGDLEYVPAKSSGLGSSSFVPMIAVPEVTPIDGEWERVIVQEAVDLGITPRIFGRVEVRMK